MQFFYDGQIRRYITQMVRLMSGFSVQDGNGKLKSIPVTYGDLTRQVANIMRDNSENKLPTVPRMAVYITGLEMDRSRTGDSSYVNKVNIRERAVSDDGVEYLNTQGKNYTVERLMPAPYILKMNVDIWASNTEQKLQIMEQLLVLFRPSLEIQTTDNYLDWTSLTVVDLEGITWSTRSIPVGVDTEIDVGQLSFSTPIYITPPAKVKKLGVITSIIANIWNEEKGTIDLGLSMPEINAYDSDLPDISKTTSNLETTTDIDPSTGLRETVATTYKDYGVYILGNTAQLVYNEEVGTTNWRKIVEAYPGTYVPNISEIRLRTNSGYIVGTFELNEDETILDITWDADTLPTGDPISGPARDTNSWTSIDKIVDPQNYDPTNDKVPGFRIMLLGNINDSENVGESFYDGPAAWKNTNGSDFVANEFDLIEWDGANWNVVFDSSTEIETKNTKNLTTGIIYTWTGSEWVQAYEGEYSQGAWNLYLDV